MKRLSSLDYLRGLAASGIMVFHFTMWTFGLFSAQDFLGRVGIYAVPIFYVLSGLTLFHVYYDKIGGPSKRGLADFAIKRVFRIIPLLWLIDIVILLSKNGHFSPETIFLNFSGLFSFAHWDDTIAYGGWSIGNELVFYLFFPLFIFLSKRSRISFAVLSLLLLLIYLWFAFIRMGSYKTLAAGWNDYTNPLNQAFLFLGGYLIGMASSHFDLPRYVSVLLIAVCLLAFIFLPATGDSICLVTGVNRVVFTLICFVISFSFYKTNFGLPFFLGRPFQILGEISYSVYLVHPLAWYFLSVFYHTFNLHIGPSAHLSTGIIFSLALSYAVYQFYEKLFMGLGKRVSKKILNFV